MRDWSGRGALGWLRAAVGQALDASWQARAALAGGLVVAVALVAWVVFQTLSTPVTSSQQLAVQRATQVAGSMDQDLANALETLPAWAVPQLSEGAAADQLPVQGRVVALAGESCAAVDVVIGEAWLLEGDQDAVEVGRPTLLAEEACPPATQDG